MNYAEKLKDPRWQKMRLEILSRDEWTCKSCWSKEKTLHVHHLYYEKGLEPWEASKESLVTLCEDCHTYEPEFEWCKEAFIQNWQRIGFLNVHFEGISVSDKLPARMWANVFQLSFDDLFVTELKALVKKHFDILINNPSDLPF